MGFREIPEYKKLLDKLKNTQYYPDLLFIDGYGVMHIREFGSASQLGVEYNIPTIGIAKTLLCIDGLNETNVKKEFKNECKKKGNYINLTGSSGKIYGVALKSTDLTNNPIYVSIGHGINLNNAIKLVNNTCIYKVPEPIRNSDIKSKLYFFYC